MKSSCSCSCRQRHSKADQLVAVWESGASSLHKSVHQYEVGSRSHTALTYAYSHNPNQQQN